MDLTLNDIVDIQVSLTPTATYRRKFNSILIIGTAEEGAELPENKEIVMFESLDEVASTFGIDTNISKASSLYFAQRPKPARVFIGCLKTGETLDVAIKRLRELNTDWYIAVPVSIVVKSTTDDILKAVSSYIETANPSSMVGYTFTDSTKWSVSLTALMAGKYQRTISQVDSENIGSTAMAGIMGYAMGQNRVQTSSFELAYKNINSLVSMKNLQGTELKAILDANGNIYVNQGAYYDLFRQGKLASGDYFGEIFFLDMLVDDVRSGIMDSLTALPKVPQNEDGINVLTNAIVTAVTKYRELNFISPGIWLGDSIKSLKNGDMLNDGYLIQFNSIDTQDVADRVARVAPTCYLAIKLSGSIEYVVISLNVSR